MTGYQKQYKASPEHQFEINLHIYSINLSLTYEEQLQTPEWKAKRQEVLSRDLFCCTACKRAPSVFSPFYASKQALKSVSQLREAGFILEFPEPLNEVILRKDEVKFHAKPLLGPYTQSDIDHLLFAIQYAEPINPLMFASKDYVFFLEEEYANDPKVILCVHHTRYIETSLAWEYPLEQLVMLCVDCHYQLHQSMNIPIYNDRDEMLGYAKVCDRCKGAGYLSKYDYLMNGICFKCWGKGDVIDF
jgi:5-methylcytosine-specific restriction endonuclease McrA